MSTHNICFHGEIRKISILWIEKSTLTSAMLVHCLPFNHYFFRYISRYIALDIRGNM